jgi:hypothetical protein
MENSEQPINPTPYVNRDGSIQHDVYQGLTKREYFAGLAMQGILAQFTELAASGSSTEHHGGMQEDIARESVNLADALLKQLEK